MRWKPFVALLLTATWCTQVGAAGREDGQAQCEACQAEPNGASSFLEAGNDYLIHFAAENHPFQRSQSSVAETTLTSESGKTESRPVTMSTRVELRVFRVVRCGGGSWVLLEHPRTPDDYLAWTLAAHAKHALARLSDEETRKLESTDEGRQQLDKARNFADRQVETLQTWVNLDHAITIAAVPGLLGDALLPDFSFRVDTKIEN